MSWNQSIFPLQLCKWSQYDLTFAGGYLSNSLAIMSDAAHLCADLAGFVISIFAVWIAQKSPTKRMSFGFYRAGLEADLFLSLCSLGISTLGELANLFYIATSRLSTSDYSIVKKHRTMLGVPCPLNKHNDALLGCLKRHLISREGR